MQVDISERDDLGPTKGGAVTERELEQQWAKDLFNRVWALLEQDERSPDENAEMVHAAHASCFHWMQVGKPVNAVRGEWQCSRVYSVLGRAEPALYHAHRTLALCDEHRIGDFDRAFAYEALARAHAVNGRSDEADRWTSLARAACDDIADDEDRALVLSDLDSIPR